MSTGLVTYHAAPYELNLMDVFEEVAYGEIFRVARLQQAPSRPVEITPRMKNFLVTLKRVEAFSRVTVHEREPALAEFRSYIGGYRCISKMKF